MGILIDTHWAFDTSEEFSESIWLFTGGEGKLYFHNDIDVNNKLTIKYTYLSAGVSKGAVVNLAESLTSDPSGSFGRIKTFGAYPMLGPGDFPGSGWMVMLGGSAGVFAPSFVDQPGMSVAAFIFGTVPRAGVLVWGRFKSILPSAGPSVAVCTYNVAKP